MLNIVNYMSAEIDISIFSHVLYYDLIIPFEAWMRNESLSVTQLPTVWR